MSDLALQQKEQITKIRNLRGRKWIKYDRAERIVQKLDDLLATPKCHRMPNLLLVGPTNNGKTMIVERFSKRHQPQIHLSGERSTVPVLVVQAPPTSEEGRFYNAVLDALMIPFSASARVEHRQLHVVRALDIVGTRMLIIDEIHHVLAGPASKQRVFLNMIKYLGNELMIPIVAVGTRDAFNAIQSDPQLANRFEPVLLPNWKMDEDFLMLLATFETLLPIDCEGQLTSEQVATKILALSEGTIGEVADLLTRAARHVIEVGAARIDCNALDQCGYVSPTNRRRPASF